MSPKRKLKNKRVIHNLVCQQCKKKYEYIAIKLSPTKRYCDDCTADRVRQRLKLRRLK